MVTFQAKQQFLRVGFSTAFAVNARKCVALLGNDRMVFVEDLRIGEHGHDLRRQDRCIDLDLAIVFLVYFASTVNGVKSSIGCKLRTIKILSIDDIDKPYIWRTGICIAHRRLNAHGRRIVVLQFARGQEAVSRFLLEVFVLLGIVVGCSQKN